MATMSLQRRTDTALVACIAIGAFVVIALAVAGAPATALGAVVANVLTLLYVAFTYGLLRAQHEDRRLAARPQLWCWGEVNDDALLLGLQNRGGPPALRLQALIEVDMTRPERTPGPTIESTLVMAYVGALSPDGDNALIELAPIQEPRAVQAYFRFETRLGHACFSYFRLIRSTDGRLSIDDAWTSAPDGRRDLRYRGEGRAGGFQVLLDEFRTFRMPEDVAQSIGRISDNVRRKAYRKERTATVAHRGMPGTDRAASIGRESDR